MEFDKSKVYTSLNADELKPGSKVICGFSMSQLKERVEEGEQITEVYQILSDDLEQRIKVFYQDGFFCYPLAYLVSEPKEDEDEGQDTLTKEEALDQIKEKINRRYNKIITKDYISFKIARYALTDVLEELHKSNAKDIIVTKEDSSLVVKYKPYWKIN